MFLAIYEIRGVLVVTDEVAALAPLNCDVTIHTGPTVMASSVTFLHAGLAADVKECIFYI